MNRMKTFAIVSCLGLAALAFLPSSRADEWNKKTILTVKEPLAVPGKTLQPGTYVMKLAESPADRHIVQIFNEDESRLETTILAIPNYKLTPSNDTQFSFWEMPAGQAPALKAWFYPGDNFGQEFAYPKDVAGQIAQNNNQNVPTVTGENPNNAQMGTATPQGEENQQQAAETPAPAPAPTPAPQQEEQQPSQMAQTQPAQPEPQPEPQPQPETMAQNQPPATPPENPQPAPAKNLPATASPLPLIGLFGLFSLAGAFALRASRHGA